MIRRIDKRLDIISTVIMLSCVLLQLVYILVGNDDSKLWWAFDKVSDRLCVISLLWIVFYSLVNRFIRIMATITAFFFLCQSILEVLFIYDVPISNHAWHILFIFVTLLYILFIIIYYERS